ncbi:MAG: hypothetical protein ACREOZ_01695 [Gloeomargaritales cyanobacterium]
MLERVSKKKTVQKRSHHQHFVEEALNNRELKAKHGRWRACATDDMTMNDLGEVLTETYELDEFVNERHFLTEYISQTERNRLFILKERKRLKTCKQSLGSISKLDHSPLTICFTWRCNEGI